MDGWQPRESLDVDAVESVGERPTPIIRFARSLGENSLFKVVPRRPWRPIMKLRQVLDLDGSHDGSRRLHHVGTER